MLSYITLGAKDIEASDRFYTALLIPLGYSRRVDPQGLEFALPRPTDGSACGPCVVYVKHPFDGRPATAGNGSMTAFRAGTHGAVRQVHAAAIAAGGTDEGPPGFRADYSKEFFVAYVRDPVGNKIALFCNDPAQM